MINPKQSSNNYFACLNSFELNEHLYFIGLILIIISDGDLITIFDSSDLTFAIQCSRILKLQILINNQKIKDNTSLMSLPDVSEIKSQLRNIRDQVNKLLDCLDFNQSAVQTSIEEGKFINLVCVQTI